MKCPYCNAEMAQTELTCIPPIHRDECPRCGARHDVQVRTEINETWTKLQCPVCLNIGWIPDPNSPKREFTVEARGGIMEDDVVKMLRCPRCNPAKR